MLTEAINGREVLVAVAAIGGGIVGGLILRIVFGWAARGLRRTRWTGDELVADLLRNVTFVAAVAAGLWGAAVSLPLTGQARDVAGRVLIIALVALSTAYLSRMIGGLIQSVTEARVGIASSASIFVSITRLAILVLGMLVLLETLGVSITPVLTALGVGGLAVALALQETLANLFAGIHVLASKEVEPGAYIRLDSGEEGYIVDVSWRQTTVRQIRNNLIMVPNSKVANAIVTNFNQPEREMSVPVQARVAYDSDLDQVEKETIEVARQVMREVNGGVPTHEPTVRFHTFGESSIDFSVTLRASEFASQYLITHEFIKRLHTHYRQVGIQIPFPTRTLLTAERSERWGDPAPLSRPHPRPASTHPTDS
ncbi:mechanosensitive ion channel protein [Rugosimonospora africana]|uniref:Mechanosensitive ion channel protein n=1 Tax=Rugosimonospora africana TaxID=556532 RepID=A0A8J3VQU8_9ACTN|nr:mechanosensitive ion channel protein [Rugosimonospora africana]